MKILNEKLLVTNAMVLVLLASPALALSGGDGEIPSCHGSGVAVVGEEFAAKEASPIAGLEIPDVALVDQDAQVVHLYDDLIRGKVVAINFIFTTCTTICPPMGANFGRLQEELGESLGREVELISVSIDPVTDTPLRLRAWGRKFGAGDGWTLVTGEKAEVDQLLRELEVFSPDQKDHAPLILLGDDHTGVWRRVYGLTPPVKLARMIEDLRAPSRLAKAQLVKETP